MKTRCRWATSDKLLLQYHDEEWGVPLHDDARLLELLILEGFQAGLSWITILRKRENFRNAFDGFDAEKIARYDDGRVERLVQDQGIIRNRMKIMAAIENAKIFLRVRQEHGSFDSYLWRFVEGRPKVNSWSGIEEIPNKSAESDALSRQLSKSGFKFTGSIICYAFMQSAGMVNDHTTDCFRYQELSGKTHKPAG
jgi:DNA-3-methyladenine glycosylase I